MLTQSVLDLDCAKATEQITAVIRQTVAHELHRRGVVVGMSGGIDSSVVTTLCVLALGTDRVLGLFLPEYDSSEDSLRLGQLVANPLGIRTEVVNIGPALEAMGCYRHRDDAIRQVIPEFRPGWKSKIVLPEISDKPRFNLFSVIVQSPEGRTARARLPLDAYLTIVASSNMKQRTRKMTEYFHAERLNYAVAGTPNRLEYDQGFFVKYGDGAADFKPIAHLYKTQVYALAEYLGVPDEVRQRPPTTDTYSLPQTQEEFYFSLPYDKMDLCLWAHNQGLSPAQAADVVGLSAAQIEHVYRDIESKRRATRFLHLPPILVEKIPELGLAWPLRS